MKDRRDESEGMEKSKGKRKFSGNKSSAQGSPAKMKGNGGGKKVKGSYTKSTQRKKISGSKDSASPKKGNYLTKKMIDPNTGKVTSSVTKPAKTKRITESQYNNEPSYKSVHAKAAREKGYMMNYNTGQFEPTPNKEGAKRRKASGLDSPMKMSGRSYDMKEAYNKDLSASARLHYLENERHDKDSPMKMYGKKSPAEFNAGLKKASADGKLDNNPKFKAAVDASPMKMSRELSYGGPVIDKEPGALSHMGASKVLRHMHGSKHSPLKMNGGPGKPKAKMPQGDTIRGFDNYNVGDYVSEDDFEGKFKKTGNNPKNYPQLSVQDYSRVKEDKKGKYVNRLKD